MFATDHTFIPRPAKIQHFLRHLSDTVFLRAFSSSVNPNPRFGRDSVVAAFLYRERLHYDIVLGHVCQADNELDVG
jgi:hypothetical protein